MGGGAGRFVAECLGISGVSLAQFAVGGSVGFARGSHAAESREVCLSLTEGAVGCLCGDGGGGGEYCHADDQSAQDVVDRVCH